MLKTLIRQAKQACEYSLSQPDLLEVKAALERAKVGITECTRIVHSVTESAHSQETVKSLKARALGVDLNGEDSSLERFLLIHSALDYISCLLEVPVCDSVKELLCEEFQTWACPEEALKKEFLIGRSRFAAMCKIASQRRFPAGQFDWEISGLPISYLLRVNPRSLPKAIYFAAAKLKGRAPIFFAHLGFRRPSQSLSEAESNKSYYRMAKSLEFQPAVKGFVASSWIRSPDTHRVSPHLSWLNNVFLENGGFVAVMGPADPNGGVFVRSQTRKRLYELGEFKPTIGLVIWPRKEMIAWAAAHPEFAEHAKHRGDQ